MTDEQRKLVAERVLEGKGVSEIYAEFSQKYPGRLPEPYIRSVILFMRNWVETKEAIEYPWW